MGKNLDDIIRNLPAERQAAIEALALRKVEEMIAHAATLADFRKAVGKTQAEVAKALGVQQNAISQLEKRSDTYVSTLRRFLKSLGMTLEMSVVAESGARIDLPHFLRWDQEGVVGGAGAAAARPAKRAPRATKVRAAAARKPAGTLGKA